jgi:thioredoxin 2
MPLDSKVTVPCASCGRFNRIDLARAADGPRCGHCHAAIPVDRPVALDDGSFQRVVADAGVPVLVDFYADWCGPCKIMAPVLEQIARARVGSALVAKVDTDRSPATARRFGIASIPTLIVFRGGREAGRELGAVPRQRVEALLG